MFRRGVDLFGGDDQNPTDRGDDADARKGSMTSLRFLK